MIRHTADLPDAPSDSIRPDGPDRLAAALAEIAAAQQSPQLASLFMRRLDAVRTRLDELIDWLAAQSRRLRRGWARQLRRRWGRRWALALPAAALVMAMASWAAMAGMSATITVGTGGCTLSAAITNANNDNQSGSASCAAGSGADTINFATANGTYSYTSALPTITTAVTIQGNGNTTIQRTGGGAFSVLRVTGGSLALANATISGGGSAVHGGGIRATSSTVSLTNATITGNYAYGNFGGGIDAGASTVSLTSATISGNSAPVFGGGGIYANASTVSLTSATISGHSVTSHGGGIHARTGSTVSVTDSTISGNSARNGGGISAYTGSSVSLTSATITGNTVAGIGGGGNGGGIFTDSSRLTASSATVSGNTAARFGGGIGAFNSGPMTLTNTTISGNSAVSGGGGITQISNTASITHATITGNSAGSGGGGIYNASSTMTVRSSIVAGQTAGADCTGSGISSGGYNIESATSCGFTGTGDQQSVSSGALALGALALNAPGTTETHALGAGSVALDQIPSGTNGCGTTITTDQRGASRPQNVDCDVGAYELAVLPTATPTNTPTNTPIPPTATPTKTNTPTNTPIPPTTTPTATNTATNTPTATSTNTNTPTNTPIPPTATPTATNTATNTPTATPTATNTATNTPTATPTNTNTPTATAISTPAPPAVSITDPFGCTDNGDTLNVQVIVNNNGGSALTGATVQATLPTDLTGLAGTCTFVGGSGTPSCTVTPGAMTWTGDLPAASGLTINYQVQVGAGAAVGAPLCINTVFDPGTGGTTAASDCTAVDCAPTAVELRSFRAIGLAKRAMLVWETTAETGTLGFNVYRAAAMNGRWTQVNAALIPAEGSAASGRTYLLRDAPGPGTWQYRLEEVSAKGTRAGRAVTEVRVGPEAEGQELFVPSGDTSRAGRPAGTAGAAPTADAANGSSDGWLARFWRWLNPGE